MECTGIWIELLAQAIGCQRKSDVFSTFHELQGLRADGSLSSNLDGGDTWYI